MSEPEGLFQLNPELIDSRSGDSSIAESSTFLQVPLAVRMRPQTLEEIYGQKKIMGSNSPLYNIIQGNSDASIILYGPPGTGKTTIAYIIAQSTQRHHESLSALDLTVKELRTHIDMARQRRKRGVKTVLFIDEVHRFSKNQQDALLAAVENGIIMLIAATTENPSFSVISPLLSRSLIVPLDPLTQEDIELILNRAIAAPQGLNNSVRIGADDLSSLAQLAGGDARKALTVLEAAAQAALARNSSGNVPSQVAPSFEKVAEIQSSDIEQVISAALVRYDKDGDQHYDVISAFIKSIRGSDVDAAIHYLARMISAGEDPRFIARRLMILASEDIGMADPQALLIAQAAMQAAAVIGMPEARINLAQAVIYLSLAPKSNAVITAIDAALRDIKQGSAGQVPPHLRDGHYVGAKKLGHAIGYQYPHSFPEGIVQQQYIPDTLSDAQYYRPSVHGSEQKIQSRWEKLRAIIRGKSLDES